MRQAIQSRFGDVKQFLQRVNPDVQSSFAKQPTKAVMGDYPTLDELRTAYGKETPSAWLAVQVADMMRFTGTRHLNERQQEQLADILAVEARELKVTEMMLFFYRFKTGRYGRFYGSVDPMVVTTALQDFLRERQEIIDGEADRRAGEWDAEARRRWTLMADELTRQLPALKMGTSIYLFTTEPYQHRLLVSVATQEAELAITEPTAWQTYQHIAEKHFPKDFGEVTLRRAFTPPVPYAAVPPQSHPQETAPTSPRKPPDG